MSSGTPACTETMMYEKNGHAWSRSYCDGRAGMIRMRVIEAEQLGAERRGALLGLAVVLRPHQEPPPRPFLGGVRQRERRRDHAVAAEERAAALVRIGFDAVARGSRRSTPVSSVERHQRGPPRTRRRRSHPRSARTDTSRRRRRRPRRPPRPARAAPRRSAPARLAPLEIPTNSPSLRQPPRVARTRPRCSTPRSSSASAGS